MILVNVHAGNGEQAIKNLKRKMQRERIFYELKMLRCHEPPSVKRVRKDQETERRKRKNSRKQMMEG